MEAEGLDRRQGKGRIESSEEDRNDQSGATVAHRGRDIVLSKEAEAVEVPPRTIHVNRHLPMSFLCKNTVINYLLTANEA